jgi:hypothetical protein
MAKKLYAVTNKNGNPVKFGNCRKSAWTSPRWVNYHIGPRLYGASDHSSQYDVHIIDFETNTMSKMSAVAFVAMTQSPEKMRAEIKSRLGIDADLQTLEGLVKSKMLNTESHFLVVQFLQSKGINC